MKSTQVLKAIGDAISEHDKDVNAHHYAEDVPFDHLPETAQFIADMKAGQDATRKHSIHFGPIPDPEEPIVTVFTFDREGKEGSYTFHGKPDTNRIVRDMKRDGIPAVIVMGWAGSTGIFDPLFFTTFYETGIWRDNDLRVMPCGGEYSGWTLVSKSLLNIKSPLIAAIKKAYPSKWTPKVGEWVYRKDIGIARIAAVCGTYYGYDKAYPDGGNHSAPLECFRRLTAEDWKVDVEGVGKVWAWYDKAGDLCLESNGSPGHFPQCDPFHWKLGHKFCLDNNIPIMPYGWKEEKGKRVSDE